MRHIVGMHRCAKTKRGHVPLTSNDHGVTLLELLIVLGVMALAAAIAGPSFSRKNDSTELRLSTANVAAKLRLLRSTALQENRAASMTFDMVKKTYTFDPTRNVSTLPESLGLTIQVGRLQSADKTQARVTFFPDGSSTGIRLQLQSGIDLCLVDVAALTGAVSVTGCRT